MNWKQKIEAQIATIESCDFECVAGPLTMSKDWIDLKESIRRYADVAVAAENSMFWLHNGIVSMQKEEWDKIVDALDKLREVGDD